MEKGSSCLQFPFTSISASSYEMGTVHMKKILSLLSTLAVLTAGTAAAADVATQELDPALAARLPASIAQTRVLRNVVSGFVPYTIKDKDRVDGASMDFAKAIGELLGVKVETSVVSGLVPMLMGIKSGRYDLSLEPLGDFKAREENNDFVVFVREYVVFAVPKGNPRHITDIADACGLTVSVEAGGSAERVIKQQSEKCVAAGKAPVTVLSFAGQAAPLLAVRSARADAFFSSMGPLSWNVRGDAGTLELAAIGKANGFDNLYQGAVVAKNSPLGPILADAFGVLMRNGTYAAIMKKWGLENNMIQAPVLNMAGQQKSTF